MMADEARQLWPLMAGVGTTARSVTAQLSWESARQHQLLIAQAAGPNAGSQGLLLITGSRV